MPSVQGDDTGLGFGVEGTSVTGEGVVGSSDDGDGVHGQSRNAVGVSGTSRHGEGVRGESDDGGKSGVLGVNRKNGRGVLGQSAAGVGVQGESTGVVGVQGESDTGIGVAGESGQGNGVLGRSKESNGVTGLARADSASGVMGSNEQAGNGVSGLSEAGFGVFGQTNGRGREDRRSAGVFGQDNGQGWGVMGQSPGGRAGTAGISDRGDGVFGQTRSNGPAGVHGVNSANLGEGVRGEGRTGVHGVATGSDMGSAGVLGENGVLGAAGVRGVAANGFGVQGIGGTASIPMLHAGVAGASNQGPGVMGFGMNGEPGVFAWGTPLAILGWGNIGTIGQISAINTGLAGVFLGDVSIAGTLKATTKQFQIDHPLDPARMYLNHASVESSEMKTIYDGVVTLDGEGQAEVSLPAWFAALNANIRYQLTAIGAAAPDLHVAREVSGGSFRVAGGPPGLKISWQITGIRRDSAARARPLIVEEPKSDEECGFYLHPEEHGHTLERGVASVRSPELVKNYLKGGPQQADRGREHSAK